MSNLNTVVFSHSQDYGYSFIDLSGVIADKEAAAWIGSYANAITAFASNPKYISAVSSVNSYFTKGNNVVFLTSYPKTDNRLYLENSVSVGTINSGNDLHMFADFSKRFRGLNLLPEDDAALRKALLYGTLSDKTTVYCVTDNDEIIEGIQNIFFSFPPGILCRSSCIEVIGGIPEVKASVVMCKCVDSGDHEAYINTVKSKSDYILIDFMGEKPIITANITQTTYAQRAIKDIIDAYNPLFGNFLKVIHRPTVSPSFKFFDLEIDKDTYFNVVAYLVLANKYPQNQFNVYASEEEKEKIEKYVLSRGI